MMLTATEEEKKLGIFRNSC